MTYDTAILVHAITATIALAAAVPAVRRPLFLVPHLIAMVVMTVTLGLAVWLGAGVRAPALSVVFGGLLLLAVAMTVRSFLAWRSRPDAASLGTHRYVRHLGFAIIGLVTGFVAIAVLRLEWGTAAVVIAAVLVPVIGRAVVSRVVRRHGVALSPEGAGSGHP